MVMKQSPDTSQPLPSSIRPDFYCEKRLADGPLLLSEALPNVAVRQCVEYRHRSTQTRLACGQYIVAETAQLEGYGVTTAQPKPVIDSSGLLFVCNRLYGSSVANEMAAGNTKATAAYIDTLGKISHYYNDALQQGRVPLVDITGSEQYTWVNGNAVLHDVFALALPDYADTDTAIELISLNTSHFAHEIAKLRHAMNRQQATDIASTLLEIANGCQNTSREDVNLRSLYIELVARNIHNQHTLSALVRAYELDAFDR